MMPAATGPTHYDVLAVPPGASDKEIRASYLTLAKMNHPDKASVAEDDIRRINEAYETLRDPVAREAYNSALATERARSESFQASCIARERLHLDCFDASKEDDDDETAFTHPCRCGGQFTTSAARLAEGMDLAPCTGCSLMVRVVLE